MLSYFGIAQNEKSHYTIGISNVSNTEFALEMDVTFTVDTPLKAIKLSQISVGINYDAAILNNGAPCTTKNCGSWNYIGGKSETIKGLLTTINTVNSQYGQLRIVGIPLNADAAQVIPSGTYILGRYRFTNTVAWKNNSNAQLWIQPTNEGNSTNTIVSTFSNEKPRKLIAYSTTSRLNSNSLTFQYIEDKPLNFIINTKVNGVNNFIVLVSPNPFTDSFKIGIPTVGQNTIAIKVYDMLGKQIENKNVEKSELENLNIGSNYPSGIYNINVSQGENSQTVRIIKR